MTPSRHAVGLAGAALGAVLVVVPASAAPSTSSTSAMPTTYHLRDSGRTVHVERGQLIRISLKTASDGGYRWVVVRGRHSTKFRIVSRKVVAPATVAGTPLVGAPSQTVWTLRARQRGFATFKAIERRPWAKSDVIKRFTLHLRVVRVS
jgi:predicted secreted protein